MKNFKLAGLTTSAVLSVFLWGTAVADGKNEDPKEVIVMNTDAEPVPVAIQGAIQVDVQSLDINSLPDIIIDDSTPVNVNVINESSSELKIPVTLTHNSSDCGSWQAYSGIIRWYKSGGEYCNFIRLFSDGTTSPIDSPWEIPPNKTLVITDVTFLCTFGTIADHPMDWINLLVGDAGWTVFTASAQNVYPGADGFFVGEIHLNTGFHIEGGVPATFITARTEGVRPTIHGYLIDTP